jgi:GNAT superfamily N-acetyltransferase
MSWHAGAPLARRIERAEAFNAAACAQGHPGFAVEWFASGCAVFAGPDSPLTHAAGIGMDGPLPSGALSRIERFFTTRGAAPAIDVCPLADAALIEALAKRAYRTTEFNNMMALPAAGDPLPYMPSGVEVREASPGEEEPWAEILARGFLDREDVTAEEVLVGRAVFRAPGSVAYWALVDGQPAAAGAAAAHDGAAMLYADSTHRRHRRRGAQLALIAARLEWVRAMGCDLAAASVLPGSGSQRNYERLGFRVCYTKALMTADRPPGATLI